MNIIIAGDLVPTESNIELFSNGDIEKLLGIELKTKWENATYRVFNLEAPLTDEGDKITKSGPNLRIPERCIAGIKALNPSLVVTANNHIMDYGEKGWENTEKLLVENQIKYIGAGNTKQEAAEYQIMECEGKKVSFFACAEHEFSIASDEGVGANAYCGYKSLKIIEEMKANSDFAIVFYHGGKEHYPYPTPYQQTVCRDMADAGADLVVCQHSHCVGCREEYGHTTIIYGQGNFIFDYSKEECWKTSIIVNVELTDTTSIQYIPVLKRDNVIIEADNECAEEILHNYELRSKELLEKGFVQQKYNAYSEDLAISYMYHYIGWNRYLRAIDKLIFKRKLLKLFYNKKKQTMLLGLLQCETHREIMETYLRNSINE